MVIIVIAGWGLLGIIGGGCRVLLSYSFRRKVYFVLGLLGLVTLFSLGFREWFFCGFGGDL